VNKNLTVSLFKPPPQMQFAQYSILFIRGKQVMWLKN